MTCQDNGWHMVVLSARMQTVRIYNRLHRMCHLNLDPYSLFVSSKISQAVNSIPNGKIFDGSKLKAFADDKINLNEKLKLVLGRVENIVGKGENAGYQHFLLFPQCFQKPSHSVSLKLWIVW